jgi:hypothetical protein
MGSIASSHLHELCWLAVAICGHRMGSIASSHLQAMEMKNFSSDGNEDFCFSHSMKELL